MSTLQDAIELPPEPASEGAQNRPRTVIRARSGWVGLDLAALWSYRELMLFLVWRDVKVRYKQTLLGVAWVLLQPVATVLLFTIVFNKFAHLPSEGNVPYAIYVYAALLPWNLFSGAVNRSGTSLVSSSNLVTKVYFPRLVIPLAAALSGLVDYLVSFGVLLCMMVWYRFPPTWHILTLPVWTLLVLLLGASVGTILSALNVRYRDVNYAISFLLQLWLYASPVAYSASIVPRHWATLYQMNPLVGLLQASRWALLGDAATLGSGWITSLAITAVVTLIAVVYFRSVERSFADNI